MPPQIRRHHGMRRNAVFYTAPDGHSYHQNRIMKGGRMSLKCVFLQTRRCHGRCSMRPDGTEFRLTQHHNHRPDEGLVIIRRLRRSVLRRCKNRDNTPFKTILLQERLRLHVPRDIARLLPYVKLRPSMVRARLKSLPHLPHSLTNLAEILSSPQFNDITRTLDNMDNIYAGSCGYDDEGTKSVIFISTRMQGYMASVKKVFSDGTFDAVPASLLDDCKQVWNISTAWRYHTIPLVRVLMQSKTELAYIRVLRTLKRLIPDFHPRSVMCDFERAQFNAWAAVFPNVRRKGCLVHYAKRVSMKARKLRLKDLIEEEPEVNDIVRSICAIPLLPTDLISRGFRALCRWAMRTEYYEELRRLFMYIRRTWMTRRNVLSVYKSEDRTNNVSESDNNQLRLTLHQVHPNTWLFCDAVKEMEENAWMDYHVLRHGGTPSRKRGAVSIANDVRILALTQDLDAGRISVRHFLCCASHRLESIYLKGLNGER